MLPKYSSNTVDQYDKKIGGVNTLVPNLFNKIKYVLHCRKLQLHLPLGVKLIRFKEFLNLNNQIGWRDIFVLTLIKERKRSIIKKCFYWKTVKSLRKRVKFTLGNNAKGYKEWVSRQTVVRQKIFSRSFVAFDEIKLVLMLDKSIYVRFSIVDLS